ncbi:hypothetical protein ACHAXS_006023 [Conticribra weissflogii]
MAKMITIFLAMLLAGGYTSLAASPPSVGCDDLLNVNLLTDTYPEEISYEVISITSGDIIFSDGGFEENITWYNSSDICLSRDENYVVKLSDSFGDGIFFPGGFILNLNDETFFDSIGDPDFFSYSTYTIRVAMDTPTGVGVGMFQQPPCDNDHDMFTITVKTDEFPSETSYSIVSKTEIVPPIVSNYNEFWSSNDVFTTSYCLPKGNEFIFSIYDTFGDGLCCRWGNGGYSLMINGETFFDSKNKQTFTVTGTNQFKLIKKGGKARKLQQN